MGTSGTLGERQLANGSAVMAAKLRMLGAVREDELTVVGAEWVADAHAAWPELAGDEAAFVAQTAARLPADAGRSTKRAPCTRQIYGSPPRAPRAIPARSPRSRSAT